MRRVPYNKHTAAPVKYWGPLYGKKRYDWMERRSLFQKDKDDKQDKQMGRTAG